MIFNQRLKIRNLILSLFIAIFSSGCSNEKEEITAVEALNSFAKLYGYVRYFHPSDEAASIDWDLFAIHGSKQVIKAKSKNELKKILLELFIPVAPSIKLYDSTDSISYSYQVDAKYSDTINWQHMGNGFGTVLGYYKSLRIGRKASIQPIRSYSFHYIVFDPTDAAGKNVLVTTYVKYDQVKSTSFGMLRFYYINKDNKINYVKRPLVIDSEEWKEQGAEVHIPEGVRELGIEFLMFGVGKAYFDDIKISEAEEGISLLREGFESLSNSEPHYKFESYPGRYSVYNDTSLYKHEISSQYAYEGKNSLVVKSHQFTSEVKELYRDSLHANMLTKEIGNGVNVALPIVLYGDSTHTYPLSPSNGLADSLSQYKPDDLTIVNDEVRVGNIINAWNVMQHFYPYFKHLDVDWESELKKALAETLKDKDGSAFVNTLRHMLSSLKDGHGNVIDFRDNNKYFPPIHIDLLEGQLVVDEIYGDSIPDLKKGDIILKIDNKDALTAFASKKEYYAKSSVQHTRIAACNELLRGGEQDDILLEIKRNDTIRSVSVKRSVEQQKYDFIKNRIYSSKSIEKIGDGISYVNLTTVNYNLFKDSLDALNKSDAVIFDLRGYPSSEIRNIISHLLVKEDTSFHWMKIPQVSYPDGKFAGFIDEGWEIGIKEPHLSAKCYILINGKAFSYSESLLGYFDYYDLATFIGEPTAGINGDTNPFYLPTGYMVNWTGSEVVKHDGSQLFGVGFEPDIVVKRTIKGVREGRDEVLDKAIELAKSRD